MIPADVYFGNLRVSLCLNRGMADIPDTSAMTGTATTGKAKFPCPICVVPADDLDKEPPEGGWKRRDMHVIALDVNAGLEAIHNNPRSRTAVTKKLMATHSAYPLKVCILQSLTSVHL